MARVAYPTGLVVVDEELALAAPARAYGDWLEALGLPDLAVKSGTAGSDQVGDEDDPVVVAE